MIVRPDFCDHWKTRLLVEITADESAPIAVLRLWSHCQHSKRSYFPDMTPAQLTSICRWGKRKPACHIALIKAGFVDKLSPKGFAAHQWNEHNAQLFQKWQAGQKGGRPPADEKPDKTEASEKPADNRPTTGTKPDRSDRPDQSRSNRSDPTDRGDLRTPIATQPLVSAVAGSDPNSLEVGTDLAGLVSGIASNMTTTPGYAPSLAQVKAAFLMFFAGAEQYAEPFFKSMEKQHWHFHPARSKTSNRFFCHLGSFNNST